MLTYIDHNDADRYQHDVWIVYAFRVLNEKESLFDMLRIAVVWCVSLDADSSVLAFRSGLRDDDLLQLTLGVARLGTLVAFEHLQNQVGNMRIHRE